MPCHQHSTMMLHPQEVTSNAGPLLPQDCACTEVDSYASHLLSLQKVATSDVGPLFPQHYACTEVASYASLLPSLQKVAASDAGPLPSCQKVATNTLSKLIDFESYNMRVCYCMYFSTILTHI